MSFLHDALAWVSTFATATISALGYPGIVFLMALESMIVPLPSELVMPFAGYLVATGRFSFWLVVLASVIGSIIGSLLSYYLGAYGGEPLLKRYGKYALLDEEDLERTQAWFARRGEATIFIGRFIPVVRHLISIPAGVGKMDLKKFCAYTIAGATLWNGFLAWLGYLLGKNWESVRQHTEIVSIIVAVLLVIGAVWFIAHHIRRKTRKNAPRNPRRNI